MIGKRQPAGKSNAKLSLMQVWAHESFAVVETAKRSSGATDPASRDMATLTN